MTGNGRVIVIGGGITGLVCAYRLRQLGVPALLLEAGSQAGGIIKTIEKNGFLFEAGPQVPRFPLALWRLVLELGLEPDFVPGDSRAPRYILKNGRLHRAPLSPMTFLSSRLIGAGSKTRLLSEPLRRSNPPSGEESLADFVRRKFDADILDYLVDPFISAVFGGDAENMGVASAFPFLERWDREGSLLAGAIRSRKKKTDGGSGQQPARQTHRTSSMGVTDSLPSLGNFRSGLAAIPKRLAERLGDSIRTGSKAEAIEPIPGEDGRASEWRVRLKDGNHFEATQVVVAAPAYEAGRLLTTTAPSLSRALAKISYAPVAVVSSGYDRSQVGRPLDGFGVLIPRREKLNTIFQVWNSSLLPGRAPANKLLVTSYAGGATNPKFVEKDEDEIARTVEAEMAGVLRIEGAPAEHVVWKQAQALPQYNVGHVQTVAEIRKSAAGLRGVHLAGNYLEGRSLGDCVETGWRTADEVERQIAGATDQRGLEQALR
jgi:oxygen-dependent protoporphyrinogen oxidase